MDQTRRQIPLPEGHSMFGGVVFFFWHFSFFHAHLSFVRMSCFHRAKILMLKKRTEMHFNTDQLHATSPFRTTTLIT